MKLVNIFTLSTVTIFSFILNAPNALAHKIDGTIYNVTPDKACYTSEGETMNFDFNISVPAGGHQPHLKIDGTPRMERFFVDIEGLNRIEHGLYLDDESGGTPPTEFHFECEMPSPGNSNSCSFSYVIEDYDVSLIPGSGLPETELTYRILGQHDTTYAFMAGDPNFANLPNPPALGPALPRCAGTFNFPPRSNPGPVKTLDYMAAVGTVGTAGSTVTLDGTASNDQDNFPNPLTYFWEITYNGNTPATQITLNDATIAMPSFTIPAGLTQTQHYQFQLTVDDGMDQHSKSTGVKIEVNRPPLAQFLYSGSIYNLGSGSVFYVDGF